MKRAGIAPRPGFHYLLLTTYFFAPSLDGAVAGVVEPAGVAFAGSVFLPSDLLTLPSDFLAAFLSDFLSAFFADFFSAFCSAFTSPFASPFGAGVWANA